MKKKLSIVLALVMVCVALLGVFAACDNSAEELLQLYILAQDGQIVEDEFVLPKVIGEQRDSVTNEVVVEGFAATWTSDKENLVLTEREEDYLATPIRPTSGIVEVTLTVTIGNASKNFTVRVKGIDAYDFADAFYFELNKQTIQAGEYELAATTTLEGQEATIAWEVEEAYASVLKIENGKLVVTTPSDGVAAAVRVVAKITYAEETATKYYKFTVSANKGFKEVYLESVVSQPVAGNVYKLALWQANSKKVLYATGEMSGSYIKLSEKFADAADFKLEAATEGYYLNLGGKYITLTGSWGGKYVKAAVSLTDTATTVFTIGSNNELIASVSAKDDSGADQTGDFYLGTYGTYATISASSTSYISDVTAIDNTQFPARVIANEEVKVQLEPKDAYLADVITSPAANTEYKFALWQANSKKVLYATGEMSGNYLATTEDVSKAAALKLESTEGGYFLNLGGKYITLTGSWGGKYVKAAVSLADTATTVFTIGSNNELIASASAKDDSGADQTGDFYLGTYGSYATISASSTSYISDVTTIDNTQYPARLVSGTEINASETPDPTPTPSGTIVTKEDVVSNIVASPVAGTEYKLALWQGTNSKALFALAEMSGNFIATTEDVSKAAVLKLETTEGGYFVKLGSKYIQVVGGLNTKGKFTAIVSLEDTASTVFSFGTHGELVVQGVSYESDSSDFYLGTYNDFATISASKTSYLSDENADVSQYIAHVVNSTITGTGSSESGSGTTTPSGSVAAKIDCTSGPAISVTKEGSYTDYEGNSKTGGTQKTMTVNGITVINDIGTSTSAVTVQYDTADRGSVRFYAGSTLTINYTGMTQITITTDGERNFKGTETVNVAGATVSVNGTVLTITFTEAVDSVILNIGAQVRVTEIAVYTAA